MPSDERLDKIESWMSTMDHGLSAILVEIGVVKAGLIRINDKLSNMSILNGAGSNASDSNERSETDLL